LSRELTKALSGLFLRKREWSFIDLRIDIPPESYGSDAINPHTQYSNPIASFEHGGGLAIGASFTLGEGNQMVCAAADYILQQLDGKTVEYLLSSSDGFFEILVNPMQLRWVSPYSGIPVMAAGLIANTLIDAASKQCGMPAWEYLARLPSDFLIQLLGFRHLGPEFDQNTLRVILNEGLVNIDKRCKDLYRSGLPVYFTTWIGHDTKSIVSQIKEQITNRGIKIFKLKISKNMLQDLARINSIREALPEGVELCVDANQTLSLEEATTWMDELSRLGILWLEEPFAPDNIVLFGKLAELKKIKGWSCEIVTGENCPNHYTAAALMASGIDRFQSDPCRMMGLIDTVTTSCIAKIRNCVITPHAGGSSLDEQAPHIQLFNLARVRTDLDPLESLTENVGFCSKYFASPVNVEAGLAKTPDSPGLLGGLAPKILSTAKSYKDGITWLAL